MKLDLKTFARLALVGLASATIAACNSNPKPTPAGPPAPPEAPPPPAAENEAPPPQPSGPAPGSEQDFVVNVGDHVYFDFDKYDLRADATPILDGQAQWLNHYPAVRVRIEGNCDERGTREYNLALGARRASVVRDYLIAHGVSSGRITTISYGKEKPIDPGSDEAAWSKNRNAHTAITEGAR